MCIIHYYRHAPCGHDEPNFPLSIQCHCEPVEQALRYYHDQSHYHLLDEQLTTRHGWNRIEGLRCPKACTARWPEVLPSSDPKQRIYGQQYWSWLNQTMHDLQRVQMSNEGLPPSQARQHRLDSVSQHQRDSGKRRMEAVNKSDNTAGPYPIHQVDHIMHVRHQQDLEIPLEAAAAPWNVVIHTVPWGCGKTNEPACLVGHVESAGPLCPWLLAHRLPPTHRTEIANHLANSDPLARGGAINFPDLASSQPRQLTGAAPSFSGPDRTLVPVALSPSFVDALGTGVGSRGMVYWGATSGGRYGPSPGPLAGVPAALPGVFYTTQQGKGPKVYGPVMKQLPAGLPADRRVQHQSRPGEPQGLLRRPVLDWPMFTGGMNREGHYGPMGV